MVGARLTLAHRRFRVRRYFQDEHALAFTVDGAGAPMEKLVRPIVRVPHDLPADRVIALLRERRVHQAVVVDRTGTVAGLITIQDVIGAVLDTTTAKPDEVRA